MPMVSQGKDYIVRDSSLLSDPEAFEEYDSRDNSINMGIVRKEVIQADGTSKYEVEMYSGGNQIPISCTLMTRFGGAYNFEEYRPKAWARDVADDPLPPGSHSSYDLRDGDVVLVALLGGDAREGVIMGSLRHTSRSEKIEPGAIGYISCFNGLDTIIDADGAYTVRFNGTPLQDSAKSLPGVPITDPQHDPLIAGSYFGFTSDGSYTVSDGSQYIKIQKDVASGSITLVSGKNKVVMGGTPVLGEYSITTDTLAMDTLNTSIAAKQSIKMEASVSMSLKGSTMAVGNDAFELFDGLAQLIDALGTLTVTSPVGICTPLQSAPTWAAQILPLKIKIQTLTGKLEGTDSPSEPGGELIEPGTVGLLT